MYFKILPKHSPGWQIYGWGFVLNLFKHNLIIGTKKSKYWSSKKNYKDFIHSCPVFRKSSTIV